MDLQRLEVPVGLVAKGAVADFERFVKEKIAPGIVAHGGDVKVLALADGVLRIGLSGACLGCSIQSYTADAVASFLLDTFPELDDVLVEDGENS